LAAFFSFISTEVTVTTSGVHLAMGILDMISTRRRYARMRVSTTPVSTAYRWAGGKALFWQLSGLVLVWLYVYLLHLNNDGLWFQGDSPRHAANGLFWWDFLFNLPVNPVRFAMSYYARYPVIQPVAYPPLFYLLEGFVFSLFGPSPHIAKTLVSAFAIMSGAYLILWLRRWVAPEAGWGGLLLLLQPAVIQYSNAVMLNVPSMALGLGAFYHTRMCINGDRGRKHLYLASLFSLAAVFTYFPSGIVVAIVSGWILGAFGWKILFHKRLWTISAAAVLLLIPLAIFARRWSPAHVNAVISPFRGGWNANVLLFYVSHITDLVFPAILVFAVGGLAVSSWNKAWRNDIAYLLSWMAICYVGFSLISFRDVRYVMLLIPPLIILTMMCCVCFSRWASSRFAISLPAGFFTLLGPLITLHIMFAPLVKLPEVYGFNQLVAFLEKVAPNGRFLYDGNYDGNFSFYVRARDPEFRRGVVLGDKFVYASRWVEGPAVDKVHSSSDVVKLLQTQCGCEWLAIEKTGEADRVASARQLRQAVKGPEFEHVKTFAIAAPQPTWIDVYRFLPRMVIPNEIEVHFPSADSKNGFTATPMTR
jgi:hypothetical protein